MRALLIDGRRVQGRRTGVGHYAKSIIDAWPSEHPTTVLLDSNLDGAVAGRSVSFRGGPTWHLRAAWIARRSGALYFSPESMIVPILLGRRALLTVHDLTPLDNPAVHKRWNVVLHRLGMRLAVWRAGAVIVPTRAVLADLARHFPFAEHKTSVIYEGIREWERDDEAAVEVRTALRDVKDYALYVGTIEPRKNVSTLIRAFIAASSDTMSLVLVGKRGWLDHEQGEEFERLITDPRVHYLGFVPDSWLRPLYEGARLFCYVSDAEGFGLPVAEAMAAGVPVLVSDDPALLEVSQGVGLVAPRGDQLQTKLEEALIKFSECTPSERKAMASAGKAASAHFRWTVAAEQTARLLTSLGGNG